MADDTIWLYSVVGSSQTGPHTINYTNCYGSVAARSREEAVGYGVERFRVASPMHTILLINAAAFVDPTSANPSAPTEAVEERS